MIVRDIIMKVGSAARKDGIILRSILPRLGVGGDEGGMMIVVLMAEYY